MEVPTRELAGLVECIFGRRIAKILIGIIVTDAAIG